MAKKEELYFDSRDGVNKIHAVKWIPDRDKPVCHSLPHHKQRLRLHPRSHNDRRMDTGSVTARGFTFTVNGFQTLLELVSRLYKRENLEKMPKELPVLFVAGEADLLLHHFLKPVGIPHHYGSGITFTKITIGTVFPHGF